MEKKHCACSLLSRPSRFLVTWQHHSLLFPFCEAWLDDLHWLMNCNTRHYCGDEACKGCCVIRHALFHDLDHCCHSKQYTSVSLVLESEWTQPYSYPRQEQRAHKGIKEDMPSLFKPPKTGVANNLTTTQSLLTYQWMNLNRIACVFEKTLIFQAIFDYPLISCSLFLSFKSKKWG